MLCIYKQKQCFIKPLLLLLSVFFVTLPFVSPGLQAAEKKAEKARKTPAMRNAVYEKLSAAQKLIEAGKLEQGRKNLLALKNAKGRYALNSYELASVWNLIAYVHFQQEQYQQAIKAYQALLKQPEIPLAMEQNTQYTLAQLYFTVENYDKAIQLLNKWLSQVTNPSPDAYVFLAQAYYQKKNYKRSLSNIERAISLARQKNKPVKENWYQLMAFLYAEMRQPKKQLAVMKLLVTNWPKREYWLGLSGVYAELNQERNQLNAMETAYVQGLLNREAELVATAQLMAMFNMPYKAAKLMEKAIKDKKVEASAKNLERLGEYWRRAQETEKALPVLAKAAKLSKDGQPSLRLAYLYFSLDQYKKAAATAQQSLNKGKLNNPLEARVLLGQSEFYNKRYKAARKAFRTVIADANVKNSKHAHYKKAASQWLNYMESEIKRLEEIAKYI